METQVLRRRYGSPSSPGHGKSLARSSSWCVTRLALLRFTLIRKSLEYMLVMSLLGFQALANEMAPFLVSGVHVIQKDCNPSALNTFAEALCQCIPSISMKP